MNINRKFIKLYFSKHFKLIATDLSKHQELGNLNTA